METERDEVGVSRTVLDRVSEGVVVLDADRRCTYANDRATDLLAGEGVVGERLGDAVPGVAAEDLDERVAAAVEDGETGTVEEHDPDGDRWVEVAVYPTDGGASVHVTDVTSERSYERELDRTTRQLETLLENTGEAVYVKDRDGVYRRVSEAAADLFGLDPEAVVGRRDEDLFDADSAAEVREIDRRVMETGEAETHETVRYIDGDRHVFLGETFPFRDDEIVGVMGISRDITEREERERRLERQQFLFERTQEIADIGVWEYDPRKESVTWSDGVRRIHGVDDEYEPTLAEAIEFYHPEDRDTIRAALDRAVEDGEGYDHRLRIVRPDGETRHVRTVGEPVLEDGETRLVHGVFRDVTDQVERERVLTELHDVGLSLQRSDTFEEVAQRTVDAAAEVLDLDLSVLSREDDGVLRTVATSEELPPDATRAIPVGEGLAGRSYRTGESLLVDDAREHPAVDDDTEYRSTISVPVGEHGNFQAVAREPGAFDEDDLELVEVLADRATSALDRVEREAELRRENDRLEEFASVVSHDLRNPLEVALGRTALLREKLDSEHVRETADALDRMTAIVEDTLTLARQGRTVGDTERVSLTALVGRCWDTVDTAGATLEVEDDMVVRADGDRLRNVFENLFRNAVTHGGEGVTVRVGRTEGGFYVEDDGPGIPAEERDAVFDPGQTGADGTGFGLTIVKRIAGAHGWDVRVVDGDEGGARFEFTGVDLA